MSQPKTVDRGIALLQFVLRHLKGYPEGLRPAEIYKEIESKVQLDDFDKEIMAGSGLPRWRAALHFHSVSATKAGWLVKLDGKWMATEEGGKQSSSPPDAMKRLLRSKYREWRWGGGKKEDGARRIEGVEEVIEATSAVLFEDSKEKARDEIDEYLDKLGAYDFQELVAALLEGMGYTARLVAAPGPDGGTDVLAYIDPLGAQTPHIRVQVKHRNQSATREEIAALRGIIRADREIGLFVSSGGFTRDARREAGHGSVHIELVDLDRFLELWIQHYQKIPDAKKAKLRLEPIHFLAPDISEV